MVGSFGKHYHPVYKNLELPPNNGIDIAVNKGEKVQAVFDGVVKQIIVMPGFNQCVLVQHGNYFSFYCKLDSVSVKAGDKVLLSKKKQKLAPAEMEKVLLTADMLASCEGESISFSIEA